MMLYHECFETPIEIKENEHNVIVVENPTILYRLLMECYEEVYDYGTSYVLSHNNDIKIFSKYVDFVYDPLTFSINDKKNTSKIIKGIHDKALDEEYFAETMELMAKLESHFDKIARDLDYSIKAEKPDINDVVKAINPSIMEEYSSLCEKILNYVRLTYLLTGKSIFIFNQIKSYIPEKDMMALYKYFEYEKLTFITFESIHREKIGNEKYTIIDKDLCIIK